MASYVTRAGSLYILSCLFGKSQLPVANYYVALCATLPSDPGASGDDLDEPGAAVGYTRAVIGNYASNWVMSSYDEALNNVDVIWPFVPGSGGWGTLTAFGILDTADPLTGTLLFYGSLNPPIAPDPFTKVRIRAQQFAITAGSMTPSFQPT